MKPFTLTHEAKVNLKAIVRFTEKRWGREQRNLYIKQFNDAFYFLVATAVGGQGVRSHKNRLPEILVGKPHSFL